MSVYHLKHAAMMCARLLGCCYAVAKVFRVCLCCRYYGFQNGYLLHAIPKVLLRCSEWLL